MSLLFVCLIVLTVVTTSRGAGSCPPTLAIDECDATCGPAVPCHGTQLCCPTVRGGAICVDPMTQRHSNTLEKTGRCPEIPRGRRICTSMCSNDSECTGELKCCQNVCGAFTCQIPDLVEITLDVA